MTFRPLSARNRASPSRAPKPHASGVPALATERFGSNTTVPAGRKKTSLLLQITRLELVADCQNQHDVIGRSHLYFAM